MPLIIRIPLGRRRLPLPPPLFPPLWWRSLRTATLITFPEEAAFPFSAATLMTERPVVLVQLSNETLAIRPAVPPLPFSADTFTAERPCGPLRFSTAALTTRPARPAFVLSADTLIRDRELLLLVKATVLTERVTTPARPSAWPEPWPLPFEVLASRTPATLLTSAWMRMPAIEPLLFPPPVRAPSSRPTVWHRQPALPFVVDPV